MILQTHMIRRQASWMANTAITEHPKPRRQILKEVAIMIQYSSEYQPAITHSQGTKSDLYHSATSDCMLRSQCPASDTAVSIILVHHAARKKCELRPLSSSIRPPLPPRPF